MASLGELHREHQPLVSPLAHDALSARLIEQAGFKTFNIGGSAMLAARMHCPISGSPASPKCWLEYVISSKLRNFRALWMPMTDTATSKASCGPFKATKRRRCRRTAGRSVAGGQTAWRRFSP